MIITSKTISSYIGLTKRKDKLYYAKYSRSEIPFSGKKLIIIPMVNYVLGEITKMENLMAFTSTIM